MELKRRVTSSESERKHSKWPGLESADRMPEKMPNGYTWPRISIVTPSLNQAKYLEETIRSVLFQGYPNLEYIIMDGGSTDGSAEIIKRYEPWLSFWASEKDRGQSHAINKGWGHATGELLGWVNSDDYLEPGALNQVANEYRQQSQGESCGLIYGKANIVNEKGNFQYTIGWPFNFSRCLVDLVDPIPQPSAFIPRYVLDNIGMLDESMHYALDLDLYIRISMRYPLIFVGETWSNVRFSPETKTSKNPAGFMKDQLMLLDKIYADPNGRRRYQAIKASVYASTYLRYAKINLGAGNYRSFITNTWLAFTYSPNSILKKIYKRLNHKTPLS